MSSADTKANRSSTTANVDKRRGKLASSGRLCCVGGLSGGVPSTACLCWVQWERAASEGPESEWPSMSIIPLQSTCLVGVVVSLVIN